MEVGDRKVFVRAVKIVGVLAPAEQECIDAQHVLEGLHDGDRTALADESHRLDLPGFADGLGRRFDVRAGRAI